MVKINLLKSIDLEKLLNINIAEYGYKNRENQSTKVRGEEETYRTSLRRQRDKILYTGGFRRLQDKTQVISATISGDHRTRLTHTLEVEQIAVSIANALSLNADLVSAIALGHDVGHTPFGHAAERKLSELLKDCGEFHHPIQSVRYLWEKYGSKIEPEIYEGILLHDSDMFGIEKNIVKEQLANIKELEGEDKKLEEWVKIVDWINNFPSTLEAQVVIWADKIAYITHDLEDFLRSSAYINLQKNNDKIETTLCKHLTDLVGEEIKKSEAFELRDLIRNIIDNLIKSSVKNISNENNVVQEKVQEITKKRSKEYEKCSAKKKYLNSLIINFDNDYRNKYYDLRKFLDDYYISSPEVQRSDAKAQVIVEWLFNILTGNYKLMPLDIRREIDKLIKKYDDASGKKYSGLPTEQQDASHFEKEIKENGKREESKEFEKEEIKRKIIYRKVATYIATMSDAYAERIYRNLIGSKVDFIL